MPSSKFCGAGWSRGVFWQPSGALLFAYFDTGSGVGTFSSEKSTQNLPKMGIDGSILVQYSIIGVSRARAQRARGLIFAPKTTNIRFSRTANAAIPRTIVSAAFSIPSVVTPIQMSGDVPVVVHQNQLSANLITKRTTDDR